MAIITISRGCYSHGKEIAECAASALGYECISKEVMLEASHFFNIPESELSSSVHDAPKLLERIAHTHTRQTFLDCVQAALLAHVKKDNIVYHGHAGHLFLSNVAHVIKIRVIADMKDRVDLVCRQRGIEQKEARHYIETEDQEREEWYRFLNKKDMNNPRLYDMVLHIGRLSIEDACAMVCDAAGSSSFATTELSQQKLNDLALVSHIKILLADLCDAEVVVDDGIVRIKVKGQKLRNTGYTRPGMQQRIQTRIREDLRQEIEAVVLKIPGVKDMVCDIETPYYT